VDFIPSYIYVLHFMHESSSDKDIDTSETGISYQTILMLTISLFLVLITSTRAACFTSAWNRVPMSDCVVTTTNGQYAVGINLMAYSSPANIRNGE